MSYQTNASQTIPGLVLMAIIDNIIDTGPNSELNRPQNHTLVMFSLFFEKLRVTSPSESTRPSSQSPFIQSSAHNPHLSLDTRSTVCPVHSWYWLTWCQGLHRGSKCSQAISSRANDISALSTSIVQPAAASPSTFSFSYLHRRRLLAMLLNNDISISGWAYIQWKIIFGEYSH